MHIFPILLACTTLAALFLNTPHTLPMLSAAITGVAFLAALAFGTGRWQPALAWAAFAGIAAMVGAPGAAIVGLAAGAGAGFAGHQRAPMVTTFTFLVIGAGGVAAALAPDTAFDPMVAAGAATLLLAILPFARPSILFVAPIGAAIGFAWGLAGMPLAAVLAAAGGAGVALCARRIPLRSLCLFAGLAFGAIIGGILATWSTPPAPTSGPVWIGALALLALAPLIARGALRHSHATAVLVATLLAACLAPVGAAGGLSALALITAAHCAPRRATLLGPATTTTQPRASGPRFPWLRKGWQAGWHRLASAHRS